MEFLASGPFHVTMAPRSSRSDYPHRMQVVSPTTRAAVRAELARIVRRPADTLGVLAFNAVLVLLLWYLVPRSWFFTFTGPEGLPYALAGWMYADVCATNILTPDRDRALAALDDPAALTSLLRAKTLGVWLLVGPACTAIAVAIALTTHTHWRFVTEVIVAVAVVPFGALAMSSLVGIVFPYHQRSLRWRWRNRHRFRQVVVRWIVLLVVPYAAYPVAFGLIVLVPVGLWRLLRRQTWSATLSDGEFALCVSLAVPVTAAIWYFSHRIGVRWVASHRERLREYLLDVDRG